MALRIDGCGKHGLFLDASTFEASSDYEKLACGEVSTGEAWKLGSVIWTVAECSGSRTYSGCELKVPVSFLMANREHARCGGPALVVAAGFEIDGLGVIGPKQDRGEIRAEREMQRLFREMKHAMIGIVFAAMEFLQPTAGNVDLRKHIEMGIAA